jgi:2-iminobutanoate/2-iminopropanoate deaminase
VHALPALGQNRQGGMTERQIVTTSNAPKAIGPYSQAVRTGELLFISGQVPIDPATGQMIEGDIRAQTQQVLANVGEILKAAGGSFGHVVRTTVFLTDLNDFASMNEVYGTFFEAELAPPARSTVEVTRLPRDARIEIDVIASL